MKKQYAPKAKNKKDLIGIFLYLMPNVQQKDLLSEGLGRLAITTTLSIAAQNNQKTVLFVPRKQKKMVADVIKSLSSNFDGEQPIVRSPLVQSPAGALISIISRASKKAALPFSFMFIAKTVRAFARGILRSWVSLLASAVILMTLAVSLLLIPIVYYQALLASVLIAASLVGMRIIGSHIMKSRVKPAARREFNLSLYLLLERLDSLSLVKAASRTKIRLWWVPSALFSASAELPGKKLVTLADYIPAEFPSMYLEDPGVRFRTDEMKTAIQAASKIICLSEHVRMYHLPSLLEGKNIDSTVIRPGIPNRSLQINEIANRSTARSDLIHELEVLFPETECSRESWWDYPVVVAPTQNRPYKNIQTLVLSIHQLNVKHGLNIRLLLTCDPSTIKPFLQEEKCEYFVEFTPKISDNALQRAIFLSDLVVSPSLFEGNMPYTFWEGVSLETPCLLANMPSTVSALEKDPHLTSTTIFNATDVNDLSEKIRNVLENSAEVLKIQQAFISKYYSSRSAKTIGKEYLDNLLSLTEKGHS